MPVDKRVEEVLAPAYRRTFQFIVTFIAIIVSIAALALTGANKVESLIDARALGVLAPVTKQDEAEHREFDRRLDERDAVMHEMQQQLRAQTETLIEIKSELRFIREDIRRQRRGAGPP